MTAESSGFRARAITALFRLIRFGGIALLFFVFIYAGAMKAMQPELFALDILLFDVVRWETGVVIAYVLPWIEILIALALLIPATRRFALATAAGLLMGFVVLLAWTLARGMEIACGCLGAGEGGILEAIIRNLILIVIALALAIFYPAKRLRNTPFQRATI